MSTPSPSIRKTNSPSDLAQKDFRIWEDGKEQKITSFSLESSGVLPERRSKHYIVMYFDAASGSGQMNIRQQAIHFVDGYASSDRYMAVLNYSYDGGMRVGQNFTTEADRIRKALSVVPGSSASAPTTTTTTTTSTQGRSLAGVTSSTTVDPFVTREMLSSLRVLASRSPQCADVKRLFFSAPDQPSTPKARRMWLSRSRP